MLLTTAPQKARAGFLSGKAKPEVSFTADSIVACAHGDAGWYLDQPTVVRGEHRFPARASGTALRIDGRWQMVQTHLSMPRPE